MLHIGDILGSHGLKGALNVHSYTRPAGGIAGYSYWWVGDSEASARSFKVVRCWQHGKGILVQLEGIADRNAADVMKGKHIYIAADEVAQDEDDYLWQDLMQCQVLTEDGQVLGRVAALEEYGAQDILTVATEADAVTQGEWMLPFVHDVIMDVDLTAARIIVRLLPGMDACFTAKS